MLHIKSLTMNAKPQCNTESERQHISERLCKYACIIKCICQHYHCHHHLHRHFVFLTWPIICSTVSEHRFCPLCLSGETGGQLSACVFARVFACTLLSITTTSFCNYKLHCTQAHHQVGPGPQAQTHQLSSLWHFEFPSCESCRPTGGFLHIWGATACRTISQLGLKMLNFILYHKKVSSPHIGSPSGHSFLPSQWCGFSVTLYQHLTAYSMAEKKRTKDGRERFGQMSMRGVRWGGGSKEWKQWENGDSVEKRKRRGNEANE